MLGFGALRVVEPDGHGERVERFFCGGRVTTNKITENYRCVVLWSKEEKKNN